MHVMESKTLEEVLFRRRQIPFSLLLALPTSSTLSQNCTPLKAQQITRIDDSSPLTIGNPAIVLDFGCHFHTVARCPFAYMTATCPQKLIRRGFSDLSPCKLDAWTLSGTHGTTFKAQTTHRSVNFRFPLAVLKTQHEAPQSYTPSPHTN